MLFSSSESIPQAIISDFVYSPQVSTSDNNFFFCLQEIKAIKNELGSVSLTIIRGEELKEQGFGGIYGVGKAASVPPALAVLSHTPPRATETVAWVGKGIVYDTGGLSIKGKVC